MIKMMVLVVLIVKNIIGNNYEEDYNLICTHPITAISTRIITYSTPVSSYPYRTFYEVAPFSVQWSHVLIACKDGRITLD